MSDLLYEAAVAYHKLRDVRYNIHLGRKGKVYCLQIKFPSASFSHLVGIQHLTDLDIPSKQKALIHKRVLRHSFSLDDISKSKFYEDEHIEERLSSIPLIESIIDMNRFTYMISNNKYMNYTQIQANYVLEYINEDNPIVYLFLVHDNKSGMPKIQLCNCCSIFHKHNTNYTQFTSKTTILYIEKIKEYGKPNQTKECIYIRDGYVK